jgi:hypothetical protein
MNKTDNIFGGIGPRSKERLPIQKPEQPIPEKPDPKKEKKREKSFVLEMKELKKQIDGEIKREILAGKLELPVSAANKRTNLSTINAKEPKPTKNNFLNMSAIDHPIKKNDETFID